MKENKIFIESLTKLMETKRIQLGVNSSIAELKGLVKYMNFEEIKVPKSFDVNKAMGRLVTVHEDGYQKKFYDSYKQLNRDTYIFDKISSEVAKKVASDISRLMEDGTIEDVNKYIEEKAGFKNIKASLIDDSIDKEELSLLQDVFSKLKKSNLQIIKIENTHSGSEDKDSYGILNSRLNANMIGEWTRRVKKLKVNVRDFILLIAIGRIIKDCFCYIEKNPDRIKELLKTEIYPNTVFEDYLSLDDVVSRFNLDMTIDGIEKSKGLRFPLQLVSLLNYCMRDIVGETSMILDYEKSIRELAGDYAKPYMTKKNITKKMESYMSDNKFLNMFGYVEADNACDLDKLQQLEEEFVELSEKIVLPMVKDHSLRFRRLGKMKADGLYVYPFKALCVDLDGVYTFVHEMFHMIDFTQGLLSLDVKFKDIVNKYSIIVNDNVNSLDKGNEFYIQWNSRNKYNKNYFLNSREIFARAGELYVSQVLGIKSSLIKRDFSEGNSKYIYPLDVELLDLIKVYFDDLFVKMKDEFETVSFKELETEENLISIQNANKVEIKSNVSINDFNFENFNFANKADCTIEQLSLF